MYNDMHLCIDTHIYIDMTYSSKMEMRACVVSDS